MGVSDRNYRIGDYGEGGGFRRALRRMFIEGDDFFGWSVPLFTVPRSVPGIGGIAVRVHLLYILFIAGQLIWPIRRDAVGFAFAGFSMASLFVLVLLHEFGHCLACRRVGGEADRVLMWPLGGLAECRPPFNWRASLITTLGGPGVNLVLVPILGVVILALGGGWGAVIYNPFDPTAVWNNVAWFNVQTSYTRYLLWSVYNANLALLLFNMLLPMYPMDCGRVVQELLWSRLGYKKATIIACNLGMVVAVIVGMYALVGDHPRSMLLGLALFGGLTSFTTRRRVALMDHPEPWSFDTDRGYRGLNADAPAKARGEEAQSDRAYQAALKRQQREKAQQAEVDRILAKIRASGMDSLTRGERATLKDATEKQRGMKGA